MLKVGIIGCGGIANQKHLPSLSRLFQVELVGFCDVNIERAENAKVEFGSTNARVYQNYQDMLTDESFDVIHVCTPNISHAEISIAAMRAGAHVMCEKPMAINSKEAKAMMKVSDETGKKLTIGYQNRFRNDSIHLHSLCQEGVLGDIYFAKAHAIRRRAVPTWGVFLDAESQGGGPLIDIGTHALDLTLWMMNNYRPKFVVGNTFRELGDQENSANAWGPWNPSEFTVEDSAFGYIVMENGATIFLESSWALNSRDVKEARTTLFGNKAGADMNDNKLTINGERYGLLYDEEVLLQTGGVDFYDGTDDKAEYREAEAWIHAIMSDTEPIVKPKEAYIVTCILEAIYESARIGQPVYLKEEL